MMGLIAVIIYAVAVFLSVVLALLYFSYLKNSAKSAVKKSKTVADVVRQMSDESLALYLHSWQVENMTVAEIKNLLSEDADKYEGSLK